MILFAPGTALMLLHHRVSRRQVMIANQKYCSNLNGERQTDVSFKAVACFCFLQSIKRNSNPLQNTRLPGSFTHVERVKTFANRRLDHEYGCHLQSFNRLTELHYDGWGQQIDESNLQVICSLTSLRLASPLVKPPSRVNKAYRFTKGYGRSQYSLGMS